MSETRLRDGVKPFCPVHHWRMALDPDNSKPRPTYSCSYGRCQVAYTPSQGYFDVANPTRGKLFLSLVELISCTRNRQHHPYIVSYAMESQGSLTEEHRQWECVPECDFSHRQKLYLTETALKRANQRESARQDQTVARR